MNRFAPAAALIAALMLGAAPAQAQEARGHLPALVLTSLAFQQIDFAPLRDETTPRAGQRVEDQAFRLDAAAARHPDLAGSEPAGAPLKLGPAPRPLGPGLLDQAPRVGLFDLTFASDVPASGRDPMFNAEIVVALTRRF
jgi:hypothetical protein